MQLAKIFVTGGGGYVGAHACKALQNAGHIPVTFDNFSTGWRDAVRFGPLEKGDLRDGARILQAVRLHRPAAVLHLAALSDIGQSMREPELYHQVNVVGTANLLRAVTEAGVGKIVFSSTSAVYDARSGKALCEDDPVLPASIYGETKLAAEACLATAQESDGVRYISMRYFNAAGADAAAELGEFHRPETHLIPLVLQAQEGVNTIVNGHGYDTPDGTCVRDYIHVEDLCQAHLDGLDWLLAGGSSEVFNLGTGRGYSVLEVLKTAEKVTGIKKNFEFGPARSGDSASLVSKSDKAARMLGWKPQKSALERIVRDAWRWHEKAGYAQ